MLGRKRAASPGFALHALNSPARSAVVCAGLLMLAVLASNCSFPDYGFRNPVAGSGSAGASSGPSEGGDAGEGAADSTAGAGNVSGGGRTSGGGTGGSGGTAGSSAGVAESSGSGGEASSDGDAGSGGDAGTSGGPRCVYTKYPAHCFDALSGDGETGVDCGGTDCAACASTRPIVRLQYTSLEATPTTHAPRFKLVLEYLDTVKGADLSSLRIRYYFNHNGVTEPLLSLDPRSTIGPGGSQQDNSGSISALVYRLPPGPADQRGYKTDSFLEVTFKSASGWLSNGTRLEMFLQLTPGNNDASFQQPSHYSFVDTGGSPVENRAITVARDGQLVWGLEPLMSDLPDCAFARGVNLGVGDAEVTVGKLRLAAELPEQVTFKGGSSYANSSAKVFPATDSATTTVLRTARTLSGNATLAWPVGNGRYWAYSWLTSAAGTDSGTLQLQGQLADKFYGLQNSGPGWALIGPYPVDVTDGTLLLSATGTVNLAGMMLYYRDE